MSSFIEHLPSAHASHPVQWWMSMSDGYATYTSQLLALKTSAAA